MEFGPGRLIDGRLGVVGVVGTSALLARLRLCFGAAFRCCFGAARWWAGRCGGANPAVGFADFPPTADELATRRLFSARPAVALRTTLASQTGRAPRRAGQFIHRRRRLPRAPAAAGPPPGFNTRCDRAEQPGPLVLLGRGAPAQHLAMAGPGLGASSCAHRSRLSGRVWVSLRSPPRWLRVAWGAAAAGRWRRRGPQSRGRRAQRASKTDSQAPFAARPQGARR